MDNILDSMGQQGMPMPVGGATQSPLGMLASPASMSPIAMNNTMGNPMANEGANVMPYLSMQQNFMPGENKQGKTYARGGYVHMMDGGNPMDAMAAQGMPPEAGGLEQAAMADPGMQAGAPEEEMEEPEEETEHPLAELAASVDNQEGMQLTFINAEEHQALMQQTGEEIPPAEQVSDNPEAIAQLMEGAEGDDYMLVYLTEEQFSFLAQSFGEPSINDASGLPQFFKKAFKKILKNPIVQALAPIALNAFAPGIGTAIGGALGLGGAGTSALLGGGLGLLGGGGIKGALKGAALGGLGQMGGEMLAGGNNPFSGITDKLSGMFGGEGGVPGFGLSGGSGGAGGINPSAPQPGLNPAINSSSLTPAANSIAGGQQKSGLASLMPSTPAGKLGLLGAGAALLGGSGTPRQDTNQPVPTPQVADATKLPNWQLNRQTQNVDPNSYFQAGGNRKFFDDQWSSAPQAAKRGGLIGYADGGMADEFGTNYARGIDISGGEGPRSLADRANARIAQAKGLDTYRDMGPSPSMGRNPGPGRSYQGFKDEVVTPFKAGSPGSPESASYSPLARQLLDASVPYMRTNPINWIQPGMFSIGENDPYARATGNRYGDYRITGVGGQGGTQGNLNPTDALATYRGLNAADPNAGLLQRHQFRIENYRDYMRNNPNDFFGGVYNENQYANILDENGNPIRAIDYVAAKEAIPDQQEVKKRTALPPPRSKLGWEADIPLYKDDRNELRFSGRGDTGRKNASGMINYTRRFAAGGTPLDGEALQMGHRGMGGRDMEQPDAPPLDYMDQLHQQLYSMPNQMGNPMAGQAAQQGQQQGMPPQQGGLAAMMGGGGGGMPQQPPMAGSSPMARGGLACGGYAGGGMYDDGGLLSGQGDGVSDDIDATIGGQQPAKLSGGEFVIPARVVSELGNGSTEAGADRLYQFMEKVQSGMRKNKDIAKNTKAYQHLPA